MAYEMLLPAELASYATSGTLEGQFAYYDEQDAASAKMTVETALPDDGTREKLQELGMHAMLDQRRDRFQVAPIALVRPLAEPLSDRVAASVRFALSTTVELSEWAAEADVPQDILDVLLGLQRAKVFGRFEVRQTAAGLASPDGVLIVGVEPNKRYCAAGSAEAYYPIARWTTRPQLTSFRQLCRRGAYRLSWVVPSVGVLGTLVYTIVCVAHLVFGVADRHEWLQQYGWQLPLLGVGLAVLPLFADHGICQQSNRKLAPSWLHKLYGTLEVVFIACFIVGILGCIAGCAVWLSAYKN